MGTIAAPAWTRSRAVRSSDAESRVLQLRSTRFQPRDALLAATRDVARLLGADSIGVLVRGAVADFLVLSDNPLEDITNTLTIERVISRGTYYHPDELRVEW